MRCLFCYIIIGILLSSQGYSHMQRDVPDSTNLLAHCPNDDTTGVYFYGPYLDENPYFKEDKQALINWFHSNVNFPDELLARNLRMNYYLAVVADTLGKISLERTACGIPKHNITDEAYPLLRDSIARWLDDEVLTSMHTFPVCEPGRHRGKKQVVHFVLIFLFNPTATQQKGLSSKPLVVPLFPLN